jgi:hypothetical protein
MDIDGANLHANLALAATQFFGGEDFSGVAERMLRQWPENSETQAYLGALFILTGETARGRDLVDRAIESTGSPPSGYFASRALAELREGKYDEALATALRIDSPDWPLGHVIVAAVAALNGRADLAVRARARALEIDPDMAAAQTELVRRWRVEPMLAQELERGFAEAGRL